MRECPPLAGSDPPRNGPGTASRPSREAAGPGQESCRARTSKLAGPGWESWPGPDREAGGTGPEAGGTRAGSWQDRGREASLTDGSAARRGPAEGAAEARQTGETR